MPGFGPFRAALYLTASLAAGVAIGRPAQAQTIDQQHIQAMQQQLRQLQLELQALKRQQAGQEAQTRAAQAEAARAREAAQAAAEAAKHVVNPFPPPPGPPAPGPVFGGAPATLAPPSAYSTARSGISPHPTFQVGAVTISLGGWVELDSIFRSRNTVGDINSSWAQIPLNNVPAGHENEYRMTARRSRMAALIEGFPDEVSAVRAYFEADFLGAAQTANSNESNSYNPRMRQYYATYDRNDLGAHLLFGQAWSLTTLNKIGIVPREEAIPITIDQGYVPGFVYTRTPQLRLTKDFYHQKLWVGASLENPQTTFVVGPNGTGLPTGTSVNFNNPGLSQLNPTANYSTDVAPDIIVKAAADPGYGHYELFALGKLIKTRVDMVGSGSNKIVYGGGLGGSFIVPLLPRGLLQAQGSVMAGKGIGRYGVGQLPDSTIGPNGEALPIPEVEAMFGLIAHPIPTIDIYSYIGTEREGSRAFTVNGTGFGYGSPLYSTAGCSVELSTLPCQGNTSALTGGVIGAWWRFLHGNYGTMMAGASYSYVRRNLFAGVGGAPYANEQVFMASLRYYPFE